MRAIALGFDLQENFFQQKIDAQDHNLRLLNYPAIKTEILGKDGQARAGAHTDYGKPNYAVVRRARKDFDGHPQAP